MLKSRHIFLFGLCCFFCIQVVFSQDILQKDIYINNREYVAVVLLDSLQKNLDIVFVYSDIIKPDRKISITPGNYTLKQILDSILTIGKFKYIVKDKLIILSPQAAKNSADEKYTIQGKILAKRNQPVPFATIYFEHTSKGTIANNDGEFRLIIPADLIDDTLIVSSMGYESARILPEEYLSQFLNVQLKTASVQIKDIIIRPEIPEDIVMQSFEKRNLNYNTKPVLLSAFFRETSKQDDDYISLTEALIEINKSSYISESDDLIRLVKGRNGKNISRSELVNLVVQGGLYNGLRLDVAKYGSFFYTADALKEYDFRMIKSTIYCDRQTYIIGFKMKPGIDYAGFEGSLYIDAESLALVRAEFELCPEGIRFAKAALIKKTPKGFSAKPIYAKYQVEYRYYNNLWNLHYAHSEINIKVKKTGSKKKENFSCNFISTSEFVITGVSDQISDKIRYKEASKPGDILVEQVQNTDDMFWINENIIMPEEPLLYTIDKLQEKGLIPANQSTSNKKTE